MQQIFYNKSSVEINYFGTFIKKKKKKRFQKMNKVTKLPSASLIQQYNIVLLKVQISIYIYSETQKLAN